jgi:Na+-transporting NADH:ubiquinone oxidoreductase subunit C
MREETRTLLFAAAVCLVCSLLLSGTAAGLRKRQETNRAFDRLCNILKVFDVPLTGADGKRITPEEAARIRENRIEALVIDPETRQPVAGQKPDEVPPEAVEEGKRLPVYIFKDESGKPQRYGFPISGKGLWGMIYGYLALEQDLETIAAITFYQHKETPGLGAEIEQPWFQQAFEGKQVVENGTPLEFELVKGGVNSKYSKGSDHAVDAISGATMTSRGVENLINKAIARYEPWFKTVREAPHVH